MMYVNFINASLKGFLIIGRLPYNSRKNMFVQVAGWVTLVDGLQEGLN